MRKVDRKLEDCPVEKAKSQLHQQSKTQFNYIPQTSFKIWMYLYSHTFVTSAINLRLFSTGAKTNLVISLIKSWSSPPVLEPSQLYTLNFSHKTYVHHVSTRSCMQGSFHKKSKKTSSKAFCMYSWKCSCWCFNLVFSCCSSCHKLFISSVKEYKDVPLYGNQAMLSLFTCTKGEGVFRPCHSISRCHCSICLCIVLYQRHICLNLVLLITLLFLWIQGLQLV